MHPTKSPAPSFLPPLQPAQIQSDESLTNEMDADEHRNDIPHREEQPFWPTRPGLPDELNFVGECQSVVVQQ